MKTLLPFLCIATFVMNVFAQTDTLSYDETAKIVDSQLLAVTQFPGELDVIFNARFTPSERCTIEGVLLGFSLVKFQATGNDTLVVWVFENSAVPPNMQSIVATYKVNLGDEGFPKPNVNTINPLSSSERDVLYIPLNPVVRIAPKRDFIIGAKVLSRQKMALDKAYWNGFTVMTKPYASEYQRFRRYAIGESSAASRNTLATEALRVGLYMRAVVRYDAGMPDVVPTGVETLPPAEFVLGTGWPNPTIGTMSVPITLSTPRVVRASVFDLLGREVAVVLNESLDAGDHALSFELPSSLQSGIYVLRMTAGNHSASRRLTLLR